MESVKYTQNSLISFQLNGEGMCYLKKTIFLLCTSLALVTCSSDKKINLKDSQSSRPQFFLSEYFIELQVDTIVKKSFCVFA